MLRVSKMSASSRVGRFRPVEDASAVHRTGGSTQSRPGGDGHPWRQQRDYEIKGNQPTHQILARRRSWALMATIRVLADINTAPTAGEVLPLCRQGRQRNSDDIVVRGPPEILDHLAIAGARQRDDLRHVVRITSPGSRRDAGEEPGYEDDDYSETQFHRCRSPEPYGAFLLE